MGFSPSQVDLPGPITDLFGSTTDRPCPHKGLDVASNRTSMPYSAGIYGTVVLPNPADSAYDTISVVPFHQTGVTVQYLHSASANVKVGDLVAPWTTLGSTGNKAPPPPAGQQPIGIHLHIQVAVPGATPTYPCWNGDGSTRQFLDPGTWDTGSPLIGTWNGAIGTDPVTAVIDTDASTGTIGTFSQSAILSGTLANGEPYSANIKITGALVCVTVIQPNIMKTTTANSVLTVLSSNPPNLPVNNNAGELQMNFVLQSNTTLQSSLSTSSFSLYKLQSVAASPTSETSEAQTPGFSISLSRDAAAQLSGAVVS